MVGKRDSWVKGNTYVTSWINQLNESPSSNFMDGVECPEAEIQFFYELGLFAMYSQFMGQHCPFSKAEDINCRPIKMN